MDFYKNNRLLIFVFYESNIQLGAMHLIHSLLTHGKVEFMVSLLNRVQSFNSCQIYDLHLVNLF